MTRAQKASIITIITAPPAPHAHHIGCMPHPQSYDRSWANATSGARNAVETTTRPLAEAAVIAVESTQGSLPWAPIALGAFLLGLLSSTDLSVIRLASMCGRVGGESLSRECLYVGAEPRR